MISHEETHFPTAQLRVLKWHEDGRKYGLIQQRWLPRVAVVGQEAKWIELPVVLRDPPEAPEAKPPTLWASLVHRFAVLWGGADDRG